MVPHQNLKHATTTLKALDIEYHSNNLSLSRDIKVISGHDAVMPPMAPHAFP